MAGRAGDIYPSVRGVVIFNLIKLTECFFIRTKKFTFVCYGY